LSLAITAASAEDAAKNPASTPLAAALSGKLTLAGSSTMAPMMAEIARRFSLLHPNAVIDVRSGGSKVGIESARTGQADIGMVSRPLEPSEEDLLAFPVGRDGVALIIHRDNRIRNLSKAQAKQVFLGRVSNWRELGGSSAPVDVLLAEEGRGATELLLSYFELHYRDLKGKVVPGDNRPRVAAVTSDPNAIVFVSMGHAERAAAAGEPIRLVAIDGVQPSSKTVRSGDHQLSRPLILLTKDFPKGVAKAFISFALSSQATETIKKHDFVPYLD
jgi:phosphate transport system substrate-binding protein